MRYQYDYAVIGAGPGGLTAAIGLGIMNQRVCLIERGHIGGDCTNYGCVPSKALLSYGKDHPDCGVKEAMSYVRMKRQAIRDEETPEDLAHYQVETILGTASFVDKHTVRVMSEDGGRVVTARRIIIATGGKARTIELPGVDSNDLLTNEELFELDEDIADLVIIGGGVIACEIAEAFVRLGVQVTIINKHTHLLGRGDPQVSDAMEQHLRGLGVKIFVDAKPIKSSGDQLQIEISGETQEIRFDKILIARGRTPLIEALQLDNAGVRADEDGVIVDSRNRTSQRSIFALGDCVSGNPQFTHWANHEARTLIQNLLAPFFIFSPSQRRHPLPWTVYTSQEVAHVGLDTPDIQNKDAVIVRTYPYSKNDRAKVSDATEGFIQLLFTRGTLRLLGATIVGEHAGEMLPLLTLAVKKKMFLWKISSLIFAYPTRAEIIKRAIDEYLYEFSKNWKREVWWLVRNVFVSKR